MLQRLSQYRPIDQGSLLFSGAHQPNLRPHRPWRQMISRRPLLVIGAAWLGLVCVSALAYHQLMLTKPDPSVTLPNPGPQMASLPPPVSVDSTASFRVSANPPVQMPTTKPVGAGWLVSLVGLCGLGCWLIARQSRVASHRSRSTVTPRPRAAIPPARPSIKRSTPKRLTPYRPEQDAMVVALHPTDPQLPPESQPDPSPAPLAPEVVPDQDALPLDWQEASLAHSLDLRQRRSLSSLI
jgi:hypothetical protein